MASQGKGPARLTDVPFASWAGIAMLLALVVFGGASRADAMSQPVMRVASVAIAAWCVFQMRADHWRLISLPAGFLACFAGICLLQMIPLPPAWWAAMPGNAPIAEAMADMGIMAVWRPWSLTPDRTLNALLACLPGFATLCVLSLQSSRRIPAALLAVVALTAFLGLMQVYGGGPYFYQVTNAGNAVGFFANRNHAALLLAMGFPLIAYVTLQFTRAGTLGLGAIVSAGIAALVILALLLTNGSRAGLLLGVMGLAGAGWMVMNSRELPLTRNKILISAGLVILVGAALSLLFWLAERSLTFSRIAGSPDGVTEMRVLALPSILRMVGDSFPFGTGIGSFEAAFKLIEPDRLVSPVYLNHAHNDYLELVGDAGILGAALLAVFCFMLGRKSLAAIRRGAVNPMASMAMVMLAQLGLASVLDYPIRTPFMSAMLCYLSLLVFSTGHFDRDTRGDASAANPSRKVHL